MSGSSPLLEAGRFGRFEIVLAERRLHVDGQPVSLGSRAFDLLAALVRRRDRVVPKDELIDVVWPGLVVEDNNLQVQISALRKVLGTQAIATVPGRGYQFTIAATAAGGSAGTVASRPAPTRSSDVDGAARSSRSRLLVADDNKVNRLLLCRSLELMGHDVTLAENGRAALQKLRGERFDLLLLDLEMPELDGFGLLEERAGDAALREVPVIVTSSLEGVAQIARCIELGADDYLHKPVNPVLLKARVDSSLERKHLRDRQRELLARAAPGLENASAATGARPGGSRIVATLLAARLGVGEPRVPAPAAAEALELLSSWATLMVDAIESLGGRVTQMTGDGLVAAFGQDAAGAGTAGPAVQAAMEMRELTAQLAAERLSLGQPAITLGIGLAGGEVLLGHAGPTRRSGLVCVGMAVRQAVHLATLAADAGPAATTLLDAGTRAALGSGAATEAVPAVVLPGSPGAVPVHALKAATA